MPINVLASMLGTQDSKATSQTQDYSAQNLLNHNNNQARMMSVLSIHLPHHSTRCDTFLLSVVAKGGDTC
jgi:hypothetical protein